jgi:hypothetical protein
MNQCVCVCVCCVDTHTHILRILIRKDKIAPSFNYNVTIYNFTITHLEPCGGTPVCCDTPVAEHHCGSRIRRLNTNSTKVLRLRTILNHFHVPPFLTAFFYYDSSLLSALASGCFPRTSSPKLCVHFLSPHLSRVLIIVS